MAENLQIIDANTMIGAHAMHRLDISAQSLVQEMDKNHVAAGLVLSTIGICHSHKRGNAATLEAAKENSRLIPVATINPRSYFGTEDELRQIRSQGFRIFKFNPAEQGWPIDAASFKGIVRQLSALNTPIMIDAARPGDPSAVAKIASDHAAPVILCSVSLDVLSEALSVMASLPNVMLETHELHIPGALRLVADLVEANRIIFGSGAPRRSIAASLQYVLSSELTDEEKRWVLGGNIRHILEAA
jgi:predicted TIM-barrel fold metal-dependent hydrolase